MGRLVIQEVEAEPPRALLEYGDPHLLSAQGNFRTSNLYSEYIITGSRVVDKDDSIIPTTKTDTNMTYRRVARSQSKPSIFGSRKRRIRVQAPQEMKEGEAQAFINFEASRIAASAYHAAVAVAGWKNANNELYKPGQVYEFRHPHLLTGEEPITLMVGAIRYEHDIRKGQTANLELAPPRAWAPDFIQTSTDPTTSESKHARIPDGGVGRVIMNGYMWVWVGVIRRGEYDGEVNVGTALIDDGSRNFAAPYPVRILPRTSSR